MAFALSLLVACLAALGLSFLVGAGLVWLDDRRCAKQLREDAEERRWRESVSRGER